MDGLTRRSVLALSASTLTALAGCSSDSTSQDEGTTTTTEAQPNSLEIENLHFCSEQPTGYREYQEQVDGEYDPGDVVWVYFEPSTVGSETAGEGEIRFAYDVTWTVYSPEGEEIDTLGDTVERTLPDSGDLSEVFLTVNFSPPMEFEPGTHRIEIEVEDKIAGTEATESAEFEVVTELSEGSAEELSIDHIRFLEEAPSGYRDYSAVENETYQKSDTIWIYFEPGGVAFEERDDSEQWFDLDLSVRTTGPEGNEQLQVKERLNRALTENEDPNSLFLAANFDLSQLSPGEYTMDIVLHDQISGERVQAEATFSIAADANPLVDIFGQVITDETDIEIERLGLTEGTLRLTYQTPNAYGDDTFYEEMGFIAGAYAGVIDEGLSADKLAVKGKDSEDQEFIYEISSAKARANNNGEITDDEYYEHVMDSLQLLD